MINDLFSCFKENKTVYIWVEKLHKVKSWQFILKIYRYTLYKWYSDTAKKYCTEKLVVDCTAYHLPQTGTYNCCKISLHTLR